MQLIVQNTDPELIFISVIQNIPQISCPNDHVIMPETKRCILYGNDMDYSLFKIAFHYAETGRSLWFISPSPFDSIPHNIIPPDKEILQLITFVYLRDYNDLITHLNGIHLWQKTPSVIILKDFEKYCDFNSAIYSSSQAALVTTSLLDSVTTCSIKTNQTGYLIIACKEISEPSVDKIQLLIDLYSFKILKQSENFQIYDEVVDYFFEHSY